MANGPTGSGKSIERVISHVLEIEERTLTHAEEG